jgi:hypothetical protein
VTWRDVVAQRLGGSDWAFALCEKTLCLNAIRDAHSYFNVDQFRVNFRNLLYKIDCIEQEQE